MLFELTQAKAQADLSLLAAELASSPQLLSPTSSSLVQQAQSLLRTCHTTVLDQSTIQAFFKLTNPKSGEEDPSETLKPPVLRKRLEF